VTPVVTCDPTGSSYGRWHSTTMKDQDRMTDDIRISRRSFHQIVTGAAAIGLLDPAGAATILGRGTDRLSWRAHRTAGAEGVFVLDDYEGEIPDDLVGTLYRTAPGESERFGVTFKHLFDGDAFLSGYSFRDGAVTLRAQFLAQPGRKKEQAAGKMIYSEFGTTTKDCRGSKNQPSVNLIHWDGRLLGLSEGDHPIAIDPQDFSYRKRWDFRGTLPRNHSFTAHPKFDPKTGAGYCYGIVQGPGMALRVYRMNVDGTLTNLYELPQRGYFMVHDMVLTQDHIVFLIPPITYDVMKMMSGQGTPADCLSYGENLPLRILVLSKDGKSKPVVTEEPANVVFHHGNAFEEKGKLMVDTFLSPDGTLLDQLHSWADDKLPVEKPSLAQRLTIDLKQGKVVGRDTFGEQLEFPRFDERRSGSDIRYLYTAGRTPKDDGLAFQALVRNDRRTGQQSVLATEKHQTVAEPVFVPRGKDGPETDGWLLQLGFDGRRDETFLDVVDAKAFERQARIWTGTHLPLGFHGNFVKDVFVKG